MIYKINDEEYLDIIEPIINNNNFMSTQNTIHHGVNKLDHSVKVSYFAYLISKKINCDFNSVARAGLLHDFYLSDTKGKSMTKNAIILTFTHHNIALNNAIQNFQLNDIEKDIIVKHMFPSIPIFPKYKESMIVAIVDKFVGTVEGISKLKRLFDYKMLSKVIPSFMILINLIK